MRPPETLCEQSSGQTISGRKVARKLSLERYSPNLKTPLISTVFCPEESSARKTLAYGRLLPTEDSCVQKSLPYGRVLRTQESCVRKSLPDSSLRKSLLYSVQKTSPYGKVFHTEESSVQKDSSVRKTPPYGRLFRRVGWHMDACQIVFKPKNCHSFQSSLPFGSGG